MDIGACIQEECIIGAKHMTDLSIINANAVAIRKERGSWLPVMSFG